MFFLGSEYIKSYCDALEDIVFQTAWKPDVVIEQMMNLLEQKGRWRLPATVPVGCDAQVAGIVFRILPGWALDLVAWVVRRPLPIPAKTTQAAAQGG